MHDLDPYTIEEMNDVQDALTENKLLKLFYPILYKFDVFPIYPFIITCYSILAYFKFFFRISLNRKNNYIVYF